MNFWEELASFEVDNQEKFAKIFAKIVNEAKLFRYVMHDKRKEYEDYLIICERNRGNKAFIHVVPKEALHMFRRMQIEQPNEFFASSVLCGKRENLELRVTCLGVSDHVLAKALQEAQKANIYK